MWLMSELILGAACFTVFYLNAKSSHVEADVNGISYHLHRPTDYD
jgi:hypothetical protein